MCLGGFGAAVAAHPVMPSTAATYTRLTFMGLLRRQRLTISHAMLGRPRAIQKCATRCYYRRVNLPRMRTFHTVFPLLVSCVMAATAAAQSTPTQVHTSPQSDPGVY